MIDRSRVIERAFPLKQASLDFVLRGMSGTGAFYLSLFVGRGRAEGAGEGPL